MQKEDIIKQNVSESDTKRGQARMKKITTAVLCVALLLCLAGCKKDDYQDACLLQNAGAYAAALDAFRDLSGYKDSDDRAKQCSDAIDYAAAIALQDQKDYAAAAAIFDTLEDYEDAAARATECHDWVDAIRIYADAYATLEDENEVLTAAIDAGQTLLDTADPALDNSLYDVLRSIIIEAQNQMVAPIAAPDTLEDTLFAAEVMASAEYADWISEIFEACDNLKNSIQAYALVDAPSDDRVMECLSRLEEIIQCVAATEETDDNNLLGKDGSYIGRIVFACAPMTPAVISDSALLSKGTDAGGSIEIFRTREDAEARESYLAVFDGTILDSGSHVVLGTMVIRTSCKLAESQQEKLEPAIIEALMTP